MIGFCLSALVIACAVIENIVLSSRHEQPGTVVFAWKNSRQPQADFYLMFWSVLFLVIRLLTIPAIFGFSDWVLAFGGMSPVGLLFLCTSVAFFVLSFLHTINSLQYYLFPGTRQLYPYRNLNEEELQSAPDISAASLIDDAHRRLTALDRRLGALEDGYRSLCGLGSYTSISGKEISPTSAGKVVNNIKKVRESSSPILSRLPPKSITIDS
jgi:hypothetical protein